MLSKGFESGDVTAQQGVQVSAQQGVEVGGSLLSRGTESVLSGAGGGGGRPVLSRGSGGGAVSAQQGSGSVLRKGSGGGSVLSRGLGQCSAGVGGRLVLSRGLGQEHFAAPHSQFILFSPLFASHIWLLKFLLIVLK